MIVITITDQLDLVNKQYTAEHVSVERLALPVYDEVFQSSCTI